MAAKSETAVRTIGAVAAAGTAAASARMRAAAEAARRAVADTARAVSEEVRESFRAWVERNFFNARAGRIGGVSYARAGELDDAVPESGPRGARREARRLWYAEAYDRALVDHMEPLRAEEADFLLHNPLVALQLALGVTDLRGLRCLRRGLTQEVNRLQARACRARYYARDNARRRALAAERRRIARRTTLNPRPTPEALRAAFAARGVAGGEGPPWRAPRGPGVPRGQLPPLRAGRRDPRPQRRREGVAARARAGTFRPLQDAHALQGAREAPPPGGGDRRPRPGLGRLRRPARAVACAVAPSRTAVGTPRRTRGGLRRRFWGGTQRHIRGGRRRCAARAGGEGAARRAGLLRTGISSRGGAAACGGVREHVRSAVPGRRRRA